MLGIISNFPRKSRGPPGHAMLQSFTREIGKQTCLGNVRVKPQNGVNPGSGMALSLNRSTNGPQRIPLTNEFTAVAQKQKWES